MEWLTTIIAAISALLGALGGGRILYYRTNRQQKELDVDKKASDMWHELYDESEQERKAMSDKIDKLYDQQHDLNKKVMLLEVEIKRIKPYTCTRLDCKQRLRYEDTANSPTTKTT